MPTISAHVTEDFASTLADAVKLSPERKPGPYIAEAVRQRLAAEGHLPGTPAHDIRAEALAAAEVAGHAPVLAALRAVKANACAMPA